MYTIKVSLRFHFPKPTEDTIRLWQIRLLLEETSYDKELLKHQNEQMVSQLNDDQLCVYNTVIASDKQAK